MSIIIFETINQHDILFYQAPNTGTHTHNMNQISALSLLYYFFQNTIAQMLRNSQKQYKSCTIKQWTSKFMAFYFQRIPWF